MFNTDKPIEIDPKKDYKTLIRETGEKGKVFVGYDNARCFSSYVSKACYNQAGSKSLAPIPVTSMIVQCIKESLDNLVAGIDSSGSPLKDKDGHNKGSFLSVAQKRLKKHCNCCFGFSFNTVLYKSYVWWSSQPTRNVHVDY